MVMSGMTIRNGRGLPVTRSIPSYLRLHNPTATTNRSRGSKPENAIDRFWQTFAESTGWALKSNSNAKQIALQSNVEMQSIASLGELLDAPTISLEAATKLAKAAQALMQPAAATIAAAPTTSTSASTTAASSTTAIPTINANDAAIVKILAEAGQAANCNAAALYVLDDQIMDATLAAVWCDNDQHALPQTRALANSLADIDALSGNLVTIDGVLAELGWKIPADYPAAACIRIDAGDTPVALLWLVREQDSDFTAAEQSAVRLAAMLLGQQLQTQSLLQKHEKVQAAVRPLKAAARWQRDQLPIPSKLSETWECGGWVQAPLALASSWFMWDVLPDGMLALVISEGHGKGLDGAMIAATTRSAWQAHAGYRHDPAQIFQRINDTLWQTNQSAQPSSLFYAQINPDTGEGSFSSAGELSGIISSRYGYRPVSQPSRPLGTDVDVRVRMQHVCLQPGETMLLYTPGMIEPNNRQHLVGGINQGQLAQWWKDSTTLPLQARLDALKAKLPGRETLATDRMLVAIAHLQQGATH